jgi:predicted transposase/invertase (TIGR01784 family)
MRLCCSRSRGDSWASLNPVYALALTNTIFMPDEPENYYHHYKIVRTQEPPKVLKGLEFVFIEIPKFKPSTTHHKRMAVKWLKFMSQVGENDDLLDDELRDDPLIGEAIKAMEVAALSLAQLAQYNHELDRLRLDGLYAADARSQGLSEGEARGEAKISAMLKAMQQSGMIVEKISAATGRTVAQVQAYFGASS